MNDQLKVELQDLANLEGAGTLDDIQKSRLEVLRVAEQAEKTASEAKAELEKKSKDLESSLAQKDHFRTKFEKEEAERVALEKRLNEKPKEKVALDVEDYIGISASLEGLDPAEKEKLAREHKLTGQPLSDIRKSEDFLLWQTGHKQKVEKERALTPSGKQPDSDRPLSLEEKLSNASMVDKEKILVEAGLYKPSKSKLGRVNIGTPRIN